MRRGSRGFTFTELLVGAFIGMMLLAILVPALARAKKGDSTSVAGGMQRDWKQLPAVAQVQDAPMIYAIGDIHGDYDKAVKTLVAAGLLKEAPVRPQDAKWSGGSAVLVCTGDMIDKWSQGVEVVRLMRALQADAAAGTGRVIITLGNHEAEFLASAGAGHKAVEFSDELRKEGLDPAQVAAGNDAQGIGTWLRGLPAAAKMDDWFFSHAGNTHGQTVEQIETAVEDGVGKQGFAAPVLVDDDSILEARMHPVPWWDRQKTPGLAGLREDAAAVGAKHLVAGHQPGVVKFSDRVERPKGAPFEYEGALFLMDTGMSRGVDDAKGAVLKIESGKRESVRVIDSSGGDTLLWEKK